jgi:hypothetical protein
MEPIDLKKLRASMPPPQPHIRLTPDEIRERVKPHAYVKPARKEPVGKGGELWQKKYDEAKSRGEAYPEKWANSALLYKELNDKIVSKRRTIKSCTDPVPVSQPKTMSSDLRCKATLLNGKQCEFKKSCGDFCRKHAIKNV